MFTERAYSIWDQVALGIQPCKFSPSDRAEVEVHYPFVGLLSQQDKSRFYRRLCKLMRSVKLIQKERVELERTDRILLAVPAVILSFGFEFFHWKGVERIEVYPLSYFSERSKGYHYGELNPREQYVRVSWKRVKEGMDDPDDAMHLLYHEYAHALVVSRQKGSHTEDHVFIEELKRFNARHYFSEEMRQSTLIRPYAFSNGMEFFAVLVETLMERAADLRESHHELYIDLIHLLKLEQYESILKEQSTWFR